MKKVLTIAAMKVLLIPAAAPAADDCQTHACAARVCDSHTCKARVGRKARIAAWRAFVRPYRAWLNSTGTCESGNAGGYRLRTTGNGFWFRYQFTPGTWRSAGGFLIRYGPHRGEPMGMHGEMVPKPLEQDVRAVRALHAQGRGAWPVCG